VPTEVVFGAAAISGAVVGTWWSLSGDRRVHARAAANLRAGLDAAAVQLGAAAAGRGAPLLDRLASHAQRATPAGTREALNRRITMAGMSSEWTVERTLAMKALLGAAGLVLGLLFLQAGSALAVLLGLLVPVTAFFFPDIVLRARARDRQHRIRTSLPDTLDQITVCVEAGLGFEAAMARAARTGTGPLAEEVLRTLQDVQLGVARKEALRALGERNDVEELRQFTRAIIQAEGYGVPIGRVLRIQASELRDKRRKSAEEKAMKVSVKMLFPLILCILPCVFIVMLGPSVMRLADALGGGLGGVNR
jgi:tight adherence protein C